MSLKRPSLSSADSVAPGDFPELPFIVILGCSRVQTEVGGDGTFSFSPRRQTVPTQELKFTREERSVAHLNWGLGLG